MSKLSIHWQGDEHMSTDILIVDESGQRNDLPYYSLINNDRELSRIVYEAFDRARTSLLWKLPIDIEIKVDADEQEIESITLHY